MTIVNRQSKLALATSPEQPEQEPCEAMSYNAKARQATMLRQQHKTHTHRGYTVVDARCKGQCEVVVKCESSIALTQAKPSGQQQKHK